MTDSQNPPSYNDPRYGETLVKATPANVRKAAELLARRVRAVEAAEVRYETQRAKLDAMRDRLDELYFQRLRAQAECNRLRAVAEGRDRG